MLRPFDHYRHVIWDWNGTILDDAALCRDLLNQFLRRTGLPEVTRAQYRQVFGFPIRDYYRKVGFDLVSPPFEELAGEFTLAYLSRVSECEIRAEARATIEHFHRLGIRQSVLSALKHDLLVDCLAHHDLLPFFDQVLGIENNHGDGKLHQGEKLMAMLDAPPQEILFVGDTLHDLDVARRMGVDCALVDGGHQARERLTAQGATVLDCLSQLR